MESVSTAAAAVSRITRGQAAFDLKGIVAPLTVLRVRSRDLNMIERQLRNKLTQMAQFFVDAPVVLDFGGLDGGLLDLPLAAFVQALRACRVVPVGATNLAEADKEAARAAGLPLIALGAARSSDTQAPAAPRARGDEEAPAVEMRGAPLVVRQAVRGGQVIYARGGDLIVLAPVNPGAQIFADGHIHVYSVLRGRAMAGAQGQQSARLFVQKLEAELVAVAGAYAMADEIPESLRGRPAQVFIENGECRIVAM